MDDWLVAPSESLILRRETRIHLEPKAMDVLCHLSNNPNTVVSSEQLLHQCWPETDLGDGVVYKNIAILRKALGQRQAGPKYIMTVPKRGYCLHAQVVPLPSNDIHRNIAEQEKLEKLLQILNRLTQKQMLNSELSSKNFTEMKKNNSLLLKISKSLLQYVTGLPNFDDKF
jgi:DNA-binding winged helix-turn-helix (wHTH) protein